MREILFRGKRAEKTKEVVGNITDNPELLGGE